jgi:hypothetical protein
MGCDEFGEIAIVPSRGFQPLTEGMMASGIWGEIGGDVFESDEVSLKPPCPKTCPHPRPMRE